MLHDHPSVGPTAIRTQFGAIFFSLELSRSKWVVTSLSPGNGEKMSQYSLTAGDIGGLLTRFADLKRKAKGTHGIGLSDHHHSGGRSGRLLDPPRSATGGDREPRGRSRLDRDIAPPAAGQDGQDRRRGAVAGAVG